MAPLITYAPRAPLNQFNPGSTGRTQAMRLPMPVQDTVTPQVIARAGSQVGHALMQYGKEQARERSVALALETMQEAEKEYAAFENDYMGQKRRKDAATAPQDFEQWMQQAGTRYTEKLKDDGLALSLFSQQWGRRSIDAVRGAGHYARREDEAWRGEVAEGEAATLMQRATALDDPGQIAGLRAEYKTKLAELLPGRDHTAHLAKMDQELAANLIGRRMAQDDFAGASALARQFKGELGSRYDETVTSIRNNQRSAAERYEHQAEKAQAKQAEATAYTLMQDFGGDSAKAFAWIDQNAKSQEERTRLTRSYTFVRNTEDAKRQQLQQESLIKEKAGIDERMAQAGKDAKAINDIIFNAPPELQQYAAFKGQQALGVQRRAFSDPVVMDEARRAIRAGDPYELVMGQHAASLSDKDAENLKTLSEDRAAKEAEAKDDLYFDSLFERSRYGKMAGEEKRAVRAQLKQEYFERTRHLRTLEERQDEAFKLLWNRSVEGWINPSTVTSLKAREYEGTDKTVRYAVPDDARKRIVRDAEKQGLALSEDQIEAAFIRNRRKLGY